MTVTAQSQSTATLILNFRIRQLVTTAIQLQPSRQSTWIQEKDTLTKPDLLNSQKKGQVKKLSDENYRQQFI
jgi:hypothetical protein